jgi:hypothetical protein
MKLKSLEAHLATIAAVEELAKDLESAFEKLGPALARLPDDLREDVTAEIQRTVAAWLHQDEQRPPQASTVDEIIQSFAVAQSVDGKPLMKKDSLAGVAANILLATEGHSCSLGTLTLKVQGRGYGEGSQGFRTVLNTALWRRKDVFKKTGDIVSLVTTNIDFVD